MDSDKQFLIITTDSKQDVKINMLYNATVAWFQHLLEDKP